MELLGIENSKNDRLKVILLCSTLTCSQTATSNITFSLSFLLFSMSNNSTEPLTRFFNYSFFYIYLHMAQLMLLHSLSLAPVNPNWFYQNGSVFWCQLTQVILEKRQLNECSCSRQITTPVQLNFYSLGALRADQQQRQSTEGKACHN